MKIKAATIFSVILLILLSGCAPLAADADLSEAREGQVPTSTAAEDLESPELLETEQPIPALFPTGVLSMGEDTSGIRLTTLAGTAVDEFQFPGFVHPEANPGSSPRFHFGGTTQQGVIDAPCIYYSAEYGEKQIRFHESKSPRIIVQEIQALANLVGAPREPLAVFSTYDPEDLRVLNQGQFDADTDDQNEPTSAPPALKSWLYATTRDAIPSSKQLLTRSDEQAYAVYPLALKMNGADLQGVWYTLTFEGLYGGGPIIYSGQRGLFYLDTETNQEQQVLDMNQPFLNISHNQRLIAYLNPGDAEQRALIIQDTKSGAKQEIPVLPGTNPTGVGTALFSPADDYLAWQEHRIEENGIGITYRFAATHDGEVVDIDSAELIASIADPEVIQVRLAGWLDSQRMVIEARSLAAEELYILDLSDRSITSLAPGTFIGFTYP